MEQRKIHVVPPTAERQIASPALGSKQISVAQFFKKLTPKTDVDRVLAAGYYLESQKKYDKFTASEVKETIREAKVPPPRNTNEAINKNIKKGLMMAAGDKEGKMAFVLTSDGEETVNSLVTE